MAVKQLPVPPSSQKAGDANELLRVFINADQNMDLTLVTGFKDSAIWGVLLCDIARHVARAYADQGANEAHVLNAIRTTMASEWDKPTDRGRTTRVDQ